MFKKISTLFLAITLAIGAFAVPTQAQTSAANTANVFGSNAAPDYSKWVMQSNNSVSAGAQTVTIKGDPYFLTPLGRQVFPLATTAPLLFDSSGLHPETLVPSAVTCSQNALLTTCTVTATFVYAHVGNFTIQSGTYGICEAMNDLPSAGGMVNVNPGFGGATATITTAVTGAGACGASTKSILDTRAGAFQFYTYDGISAFAASLSPFNTTTAANADITTAVGSPFFYTGGRSNATNYGIANVANSANSSGAKTGGLKTRATSADGNANTTIVTGDDLFDISAWGADGTDYINSAGILFDSTGTIAATRVPSVIKFYTGTDAAPTVKTLALTIAADQSATLVGGLTAANLTDSALTSGRVAFAGTAGLLADDSDLTFAGSTLTVTNIINSTTLKTPAIFNTAGALALATVTSGNITINPAVAATAAVTTNTRLETAKGADVVSGSCSSGDCTFGGDGNVFTVSGTTTVDGFATAGWQTGSIVYVLTSGNITFNSAGTVAGGFAAMALTGNLSMTANDCLTLLYNGTTWEEVALIQR